MKKVITLDEINIREMQITDYYEVRKIWEAEPGITITSVDSYEGIKKLLEHSPGLSLVAVHNCRIVGSVLGSQDTRRGYIHHLVVIPEYRKIGLGKKLLQQILANFKRIGIPKVHLFVVKSNKEAEEFYRHLGWQERIDLTMFSYTLF